MAKHFRAPIFDTFRAKNPFDGLWEHAGKINECLDALDKTTRAFCAGEGDAAREHAELVNRLELEADHIKSNVRNHLPANVRMSVDKALFLATLSRQDGILDGAEDAAMWMTMRDSKVPDDVAEGLMELLGKVRETVNAYSVAVENVKDLLETGFGRREREEEKSLIHTVHELEHETDVIGRRLTRVLLTRKVEKDVGSVGTYHLLRLVDIISNIADTAENAGDRLRAMMAR